MGSFQVKILIHPDRTLHRISSQLHGFFIEHVGESVYNGLWVKGSSSYSKHAGLRTQIMEPLRRLSPGIIQWPGGRFANLYHWADGVGPRASRPSTLNLVWGGEQPHQFGTDEFNTFCQKVGGAPHLCLNTGTGSVREALDWFEYCNLEKETRYGRLRSMENNPEPFHVKNWSVGYEPWERGGLFTPASYAQEFLHIAAFFKSLDPDVSLFGCGHLDQSWNLDFLEALGTGREHLNHLAIPVSFSTVAAGGSIPDRDSEYYSIFSYLPMLEDHLLQTIKTLRYSPGAGQTTRIAFTEWGVQHPEATKENGLVQPATLRDALMAACTLHLFYTYAAHVSVAQISQPVNVLHALVMTRDESIGLTPTYHVFDLFKEHLDRSGIAVSVHAPRLPIEGKHGTCRIPAVNAFASTDEDGRQVVLTLVNLHIENEAVVSLFIKGRRPIEKAKVYTLTADSPVEQFDFTAPYLMEPQETVLERLDNPAVKILPPHSVTKIALDLA